MNATATAIEAIRATQTKSAGLDVAGIHPNWRALDLAHIRMVRAMVREGRHVTDGRRIIKAAQQTMLATRRALAVNR